MTTVSAETGQNLEINVTYALLWGRIYRSLYSFGRFSGFCAPDLPISGQVSQLTVTIVSAETGQIYRSHRTGLWLGSRRNPAEPCPRLLFGYDTLFTSPFGKNYTPAEVRLCDHVYKVGFRFALASR